MPRLPRLLQAPSAATLSLGAFLVPAWLLSIVVSPPEVRVSVMPDRTVTVAHLTLAAGPGADEGADEGAEEGADEPVAEPAAAEPAAPAPPVASPEPQPVIETAPPQRVVDNERRAVIRERMKARRAARLDAQTTVAATETAPKRSRKRSCLEGDNPDIAEVGVGEYAVARALVDYYTDDLKEAARLASVAWHEDDQGKVDGFRIRHIRCGSVLYEAGLRNGDVVHQVNGRPVRNIAQALVAYRKLRKKRRLWLDVTRKGELMGLKYKLS